jgi:flagellar biosynthesis/type III secretory pathway M-ring protein FliF/YscJ
MLRVFFFSIIRVLLIALAVYFVITVIRGVVRALSGRAQSSSSKASGRPQSENPPKPTEEYKDVKDAKFVELSNNKHEEKSGGES